MFKKDLIPDLEWLRDQQTEESKKQILQEAIDKLSPWITGAECIQLLTLIYEILKN